MIEIYGLGGLIVLVLSIWAIVSIVGSGATTGGKILWILFVLLLPIVGFICWALFGPKGAAQRV